MVLKQVLSTLEAVAAEGFKVIPEIVRAVGEVTHRLRWFIVGVVIVFVVQGLVPYLLALWVGKSLFSFLFFLLR